MRAAVLDSSLSAFTPPPSLPPPPRLILYRCLSLSSAVSLLGVRNHLDHPFAYSRRPLADPCRSSVAESSSSAVAIQAANPKSESGILPFLLELGLDAAEHGPLLRKHPVLDLVPTKSLRIRVAGLESVGLTGLALRSTVLKRPELLTALEVGPFVDFLRNEDIIPLPLLNPTQLEKLLLSAEPRSLPGFPTRVQLLLDYGVPTDKLALVLNSINIKKVFCERTIEDLEEILGYLEEVDGIQWVVRRPQVLNLDLRTQLGSRVEYLASLAGGDRNAASRLIRKLPYILAYTVEHYQDHVQFWRSVGLSDAEVFKVAQVYPSLFSVSRERKLVPRVEFLRECGMHSGAEVFRFLVRSPLFLSLSFEYNLAKKLVFLVKLGYRHRTKELALALGAVTRTSCLNLQAVVELLLEYGFSFEDVLVISRRQPQVLQYNCKSLEKKLEYLVGEMNREVSELLSFPAFLGYELDGRIKRRYEAKRKIRGEGMSINKLLSVSAKRFYWDDEISCEEVDLEPYSTDSDESLESSNC